MTKFWHAIKKTLHHKSDFFDVHESPAAAAKKGHQDSNHEKTSTCWRFGCSRSISSLKDVVHGCNRLPNPPPSSICSSRSVGSSDLVDTLAHEVVSCGFNNELKITAGHLGHGGRSYGCDGGPLADPAFMGNERDGIRIFTASRGSCPLLGGGGGLYDLCAKENYGILACHYCGKESKKWQDLEDHHVCNHAVTELEEGEFSRKIVEKICQSSFSYSIYGRRIVRTERILKVHHMQRTLAKFEEYRESVKIRAVKFQHKHARCVADGNELLRFHGTTISCSLGVNGSSSLCSSPNCNGCQIIRRGFPTKWEMKAGVGVFTASTWETALESIDTAENVFSSQKAVLVCRVIAGRIHKPIDSFREMIGLSDFDSVAGKIGRQSNLEELYLLNPRALLPCFAVIDKS